MGTPRRIYTSKSWTGLLKERIRYKQRNLPECQKFRYREIIQRPASASYRLQERHPGGAGPVRCKYNLIARSPITKGYARTRKGFPRSRYRMKDETFLGGGKLVFFKFPSVGWCYPMRAFPAFSIQTRVFLGSDGKPGPMKFLSCYAKIPGFPFTKGRAVPGGPNEFSSSKPGRVKKSSVSARRFGAPWV